MRGGGGHNRRERNRHRAPPGQPCDRWGRDPRRSAISRGTPKMARSPQKLEEARKGSPLEAPEGAWACRQPDFRPLPPEYDRRCVCCCKAPRLWHFVAPVPVLEGHTLCGHTSSRWQRRDSYPGVSAPQGRGISFPPFLQSAIPPAVGQATVQPLPGFSAIGQRVDTSRTSHVVTVIMILPH